MTQGLATKGRASVHMAIGMATGGVISIQPSRRRRERHKGPSSMSVVIRDLIPFFKKDRHP